MSQSRKASLIESLANIVVGLIIQCSGQAGLFYLLHIKVSPTQFGLFTAVMTVLSVARSYCLRRLWNAEWWKRFQPKTKCLFCKKKIDPEWCWYGEPYKAHANAWQLTGAERKAWLAGDWTVGDFVPHPHEGPQKKFIKDPTRFDHYPGQNW